MGNCCKCPSQLEQDLKELREAVAQIPKQKHPPECKVWECEPCSCGNGELIDAIDNARLLATGNW